MFERFTAYARRVVVQAQEEARRLNHNYIGTEHLLLGLLGEAEGTGCQVLESFGMTLDGARQEVTDLVGPGKRPAPGGHIPFTPRAKKTLELSLREAVRLRHHYIGTEHILLGLLRESDGVAAQVMREHAELLAIRAAVLDAVPPGEGEAESGDETTSILARLLRPRRAGSARGGQPRPAAGWTADEPAVRLSPAGEVTLTEATRLAGERPVGSHHLLLAALADSDSAAARALAALGVDLDQAREALRAADVTGTTDERPEEAGRRQMIIRLAEDKLTVEAADPVIVAAAQAALGALGDEAVAAGVIRGDQPGGAVLGAVWLALRESLAAIQRKAEPPEAA